MAGSATAPKAQQVERAFRSFPRFAGFAVTTPLLAVIYLFLLAFVMDGRPDTNVSAFMDVLGFALVVSLPFAALLSLVALFPGYPVWLRLTAWVQKRTQNRWIATILGVASVAGLVWLVLLALYAILFPISFWQDPQTPFILARTLAVGLAAATTTGLLFYGR